MVILFAIFILFGMIIGSFLNVCITRIPEGISIVSPGSRCPKCGAQIKPYHNVPVFGWLWLGGKCYGCQAPISPMYPLVEFATGMLFGACFLRFGISLDTAKWLVFTCLIIVLAITDLRVRLLPDVINWPGAVCGLIFSAFVPLDDGTASLIGARVFHLALPWGLAGLMEALLGALFGSFLLWGTAAAYKMVRGRDGMGMGDVKMMAMIGAFLGLRGAFLTILLGTLLGSVVGVLVVAGFYAAREKVQVAERANRRGMGSIRALRWAIASRYQLPLGTFLGLAALAVMFVFFSPGPQLPLFVR